MGMNFKRKLPIPMEIKEQLPLTIEMEQQKVKNDAEIKAVFTGESDSFWALMFFMFGGFWILIFVGGILGVIGVICEKRKKQANSSTQS